MTLNVSVDLEELELDLAISAIEVFHLDGPEAHQRRDYLEVKLRDAFYGPSEGPLSLDEAELEMMIAAVEVLDPHDSDMANDILSRLDDRLSALQSELAGQIEFS